MNEWTFAAEIKSWWDDEFSAHPEYQLTACRVEKNVAETRKRSDLHVEGKKGPVLTGELRLPDHPNASPWHPDNLLDAVNKATTTGSRWAFTSDGTVLLLIDTNLSGPPLARITHQVEVIEFGERDQLDSATFLTKVKDSWVRTLHEVGPIIAGLRAPPGMSPDAVFINSLRALLSAPVAATRDALNQERTNDPVFEQRLVEWMVDEQGWTHVPQKWEEEVKRAAQLTGYVFTTRLMFYEALRRAHSALGHLDIPEASASVVAATFRAYFEKAREESGDYETLFEWDEASEFALLADAAVPGWRRVVDHLEVFDLSTIDYDILGKLFERLIDPHERYRWGQHYTNPDVVDLMLSFALPQGSGRLLDPAAGGGTFLVRGYVRKQNAEPDKSHQDLLEDLYGIDISAFAATIATVNLAVRHLDLEDNYPRIAPKSFFQIEPADTFMALPGPKSVGLDGGATREVAIERVDAVVCNPPYIRRQELGPERLREVERVLGRQNRWVRTPEDVHGLSNYHLYFWFHASRFIEPGGRLVFITAGEWMDSDYGVALQEWLLNNFAIEAVIESLAEPWFSEARVGTVVLVARLCPGREERENNVVRFVMLRKPLRDLYGRSNGSVAEQVSNIDALRDRILALSETVGETEQMDWTLIRQSDLWEAGTEE